jgi:hypothetical protein
MTTARSSPLVPVGDGWPDWRHGSAEQLRHALMSPVTGVLFDVEHNVFWDDRWGARFADTRARLELAAAKLADVPQMVPVYAHRYLPAGRGTFGHPVLSFHQTDIICYGMHLVDYVFQDFGAGTGYERNDPRCVVIAGKAARAVGGPADHRGIASPNLETAARAEHVTDRHTTIIGWICAAIACGATLFLLGTIIRAYVLALHERLVPADQFGFRDGTTYSCWPRWYASQKAGFRWLLFGYGPVLIASIVVFIGAAIQRRPLATSWCWRPVSSSWRSRS